MSDVKSVIMLLCKHFSLSINVSIKPECFRLAKFNESSDDTEQSLWTVLHTLSFYAARDKKEDLHFEDYDKISATKLYLAFLRYPSIEFYGKSEKFAQSRELLLALCWLLTTQNALDIVIRTILVTGVLGREYSHADITVRKASLLLPDETCSSTNVQLRTIEHCSSKIYFNLKQISELIEKKTRLTNKIHAASSRNDGVIHPNVLIVVLMKRLIANFDDLPSNLDKLQLKELRRIRLILDIHRKWIEREHIFYDWMISVTREHKRFLCTNAGSSVNLNETAKFCCLLRHILTRKLSAPTTDTLSNAQFMGGLCALRLLKRPHGESVASHWTKMVSLQLNLNEEKLRKNEKELAQHLGTTLSSMLSCIQI